jgi:hypothetical protein
VVEARRGQDVGRDAHDPLTIRILERSVRGIAKNSMEFDLTRNAQDRMQVELEAETGWKSSVLKGLSSSFSRSLGPRLVHYMSLTR